MELKRRLDFRVVFVGLYMFVFLIYLVVGINSATAVQYEVTGKISIPIIGLNSDVAKLEYNGDKLETPEMIVGSYSKSFNKTLLIGHSTTVFSNLDLVSLGDKIEYDDASYRVIAVDMMPKDSIDMHQILEKTDQKTIIIMTCAGELFGDGDASHRLIITALSE